MLANQIRFQVDGVAFIQGAKRGVLAGERNKGDTVNLETDLIGKHVRRTLETSHAPTPLTLERLRDAGFGEAE